MPTVNMALDNAQYIAAAQQLITTMGGQADAIQQIISVSERFNQQGQVTGATVKALTRDYKTLAFTIKEVTAEQRAAAANLKKGLPVPAGTPDFTVGTSRLTETVKRQKPPVNVQELFDGSKVTDNLRNLFPVPPQVTIAQLTKYEAAMNRIQNLLSTGKVSFAKFDHIFGIIQGQGGKGLNSLKLTGDEQKLVTAIGDITKGFETATTTGQKFGLKLRDAFRITEALLLKEAIGALVAQLQRATLEAVKYQIKISEIRTLAQENQASFSAWSQSIEDVSNALGIPAIEVATAAYEALSSQIVSGREETEQFVRAAGTLSRVGVSTIADAGKVLSSVFNSYGLGVERAEEVSSKLFTAVDRGNFTIGQLGDQLGRVTGPGAALGITFDQLLGALTTLSRTNNPADSVTQLSNVLLKLQKPTEATSRFLTSMGFSTSQTAIQVKGLTGLLQELEKATQNDVAVLAEFGGELRAIRGLIGLTGNNKGPQFREDVSAIENNSVETFRKAQLIRGESAGDQLTREFTKIKNFFVNDFGQSLLESTLVISNYLGGLERVVQLVTRGLIGATVVYGGYIIATKAAAFATFSLDTAVAGLGIRTVTTTGSVTLLGGAVKLLSATLTSAATVFVAALATDQIIKTVREVQGLNKVTVEYENTLKRIKEAREGRTETGETDGQRLFQASALRQASEFNSVVDSLFRPLLQQEAVAAQKANAVLRTVKEEAKEAALQLGVAFKGTTDAINSTTKSYAQNIANADKAINDSKKNILSLKDTVQSVIFDLKNDFASDEQKFILRRQEIDRLEAEAIKLFQSDNEEDFAKAQQLAIQSIRLRKDDAKARGDAQVAEERARREFQFNQTGRLFPNNTPIQPNLAEDFENIRQTGLFFEQLNAQAAARREREKKDNEVLIAQDKERVRLLTKRIEDLSTLTTANEAGNILPQFATPTGQFNETAFNKEVQRRTKLVTDLLTEEERRTFGVTELEKFRLSLIKQQQAQLEAQKISTRQLQLGQQQNDIKQQFEKAASERIKASAEVELASKELAVSTQIVRGFLDRSRTDNSILSIGQGENKVVEFGQRVTKVLLDAVNTLPGQDVTSERERVVQQNLPTFQRIVDLQDAFNKERDRLTTRDASGRLVGNQENINTLRSIKTELILTLENFVGKFTGQLNNDNFAVPGGATIGELRNQVNQAIQQVETAINRERAFAGQQESLVNDLRNVFDPAAFAAAQASLATRDNTLSLQSATTAVNNLTTRLNQQVIAPPVNIPPVIPPGGGGYHDGGLIKGPSGYDNLLIRAEAGEFVVSQRATRKWLPQLIAMNQGKAPAVPGRYHEGGLVQTNVGDVNVTISGPTTPQKTIREIGKSLRREIRRGGLKLGDK